MQGKSEVCKLYYLWQLIYESYQICSKVTLVIALSTTSSYSESSGGVKPGFQPAKSSLNGMIVAKSELVFRYLCYNIKHE